MSGQSIRRFFRELFGSRVVEVLTAQIEMMKSDHALNLADKDDQIERLEESILRLRGDCDTRLKDREDIISTLRAEIAALQGKVYLYEQTLLPLASRAGADVVAAGKPKRQPSFASTFSEPPVKTRWQVLQEEHDAQMEKERQEDAARAAMVTTQAAALGGNSDGR